MMLKGICQSFGLTQRNYLKTFDTDNLLLHKIIEGTRAIRHQRLDQEIQLKKKIDFRSLENRLNSDYDANSLRWKVKNSEY